MHNMEPIMERLVCRVREYERRNGRRPDFVFTNHVSRKIFRQEMYCIKTVTRSELPELDDYYATRHPVIIRFYSSIVAEMGKQKYAH